MNKNKYIFCIILWTFFPQCALALDLELSDKIREAREEQMIIERTQMQQYQQQNVNDYSQKNDLKSANNDEKNKTVNSAEQ